MCAARVASFSPVVSFSCSLVNSWSLSSVKRFGYCTVCGNWKRARSMTSFRSPGGIAASMSMPRRWKTLFYASVPLLLPPAWVDLPLSDFLAMLTAFHNSVLSMSASGTGSFEHGNRRNEFSIGGIDFVGPWEGSFCNSVDSFFGGAGGRDRSIEGLGRSWKERTSVRKERTSVRQLRNCS